MSSIIAASVFVPLMIVMVTALVDKVDQKMSEEAELKSPSEKKNGEDEPPNDLIDLSGGMYGI